MKYNKIDELQVFITESIKEMGKLSGNDVAVLIKTLLKEKEFLNIMFAAAPSQDDVLSELITDKDIKWDRINAFHMDEYLGLEDNSPQKFGNYLKKKIFDKVSFKQVFYINSDSDPYEEAKRYEKLLREYPIDICILGVGENGHLAFNDPGEADFNDAKFVKIVNLDDVCRQQQVNDGCFKKIEDVPTQALTVTIPGLLQAKAMFCVVPTINKANAVKNMLEGEINCDCPASILRKKSGARLYLDPFAAEYLD